MAILSLSFVTSILKPHKPHLSPPSHTTSFHQNYSLCDHYFCNSSGFFHRPNSELSKKASVPTFQQVIQRLQAGSLQLMQISVEITYGLERILMLLQGVDHFKKIQYADGITYGELFSENKKEMSAYYLEHASVEHIKKHFDFFEAEARSLLDLDLAIPAYDQLLKTSHAFNILDSRGFVGVTERARYFGRMRIEVDDFVETSSHLLQSLEDFFDHVFVMVEDEKLRKNRLALLQKIADLPKGIVDLSVLPGF